MFAGSDAPGAWFQPSRPYQPVAPTTQSDAVPRGPDTDDDADVDEHGVPLDRGPTMPSLGNHSFAEDGLLLTDTASSGVLEVDDIKAAERETAQLWDRVMYRFRTKSEAALFWEGFASRFVFGFITVMVVVCVVAPFINVCTHSGVELGFSSLVGDLTGVVVSVFAPSVIAVCKPNMYAESRINPPDPDRVRQLELMSWTSGVLTGELVSMFLIWIVSVLIG